MVNNSVIVRLLASLSKKHSFYTGLVVAAYKSGVVEVAFLSRLLFGQDVTVVSMLTLDFSGAGKRETLFGSGFGFHSWHYFTVLS